MKSIPLKSTYRKIIRKFAINYLMSFYRDESYDLVLKHLPKPFSKKRTDEVTLNILRVLALKKMNQAVWQDEFNYLIEEDMLNVFNKDTQLYLNIFLTYELLGSYELPTLEINLDLVPKSIKNCFTLSSSNSSLPGLTG